MTDEKSDSDVIPETPLEPLEVTIKEKDKEIEKTFEEMEYKTTQEEAIEDED